MKKLRTTTLCLLAFAPFRSILWGPFSSRKHYDCIGWILISALLLLVQQSRTYGQGAIYFKAGKTVYVSYVNGSTSEFCEVEGMDPLPSGVFEELQDYLNLTKVEDDIIEVNYDPQEPVQINSIHGLVGPGPAMMTVARITHPLREEITEQHLQADGTYIEESYTIDKTVSLTIYAMILSSGRLSYGGYYENQEAASGVSVLSLQNTELGSSGEMVVNIPNGSESTFSGLGGSLTELGYSTAEQQVGTTESGAPILESQLVQISGGRYPFASGLSFGHLFEANGEIYGLTGEDIWHVREISGRAYAVQSPSRVGPVTGEPDVASGGSIYAPTVWYRHGLGDSIGIEAVTAYELRMDVPIDAEDDFEYFGGASADQYCRRIIGAEDGELNPNDEDWGFSYKPDSAFWGEDQIIVEIYLCSDPSVVQQRLVFDVEVPEPVQPELDTTICLESDIDFCGRSYDLDSSGFRESVTYGLYDDPNVARWCKLDLDTWKKEEQEADPDLCCHVEIETAFRRTLALTMDNPKGGSDLTISGGAGGKIIYEGGLDFSWEPDSLFWGETEITVEVSDYRGIRGRCIYSITVVEPLKFTEDVKICIESEHEFCDTTYTGESVGHHEKVDYGIYAGQPNLARWCVLDLDTFPRYRATTTKTLCYGDTLAYAGGGLDTLFYENLVYTEDVIFNDRVINIDDNGCQEHHDFDIKFLRPDVEEVHTVVLESGESYEFEYNGKTYLLDKPTASANYSFDVGDDKSANGCVSVIIVRATIVPVGSGVSTHYICEGESFSYTNVATGQSGELTESGLAQIDVDSFVNVVVEHPIIIDTVFYITSGFYESEDWDGNPDYQIKLNGGIGPGHTYTIPSVRSGCDSVIIRYEIKQATIIEKRICHDFNEGSINYRGTIYTEPAKFDFRIGSTIYEVEISRKNYTDIIDRPYESLLARNVPIDISTCKDISANIDILQSYETFKGDNVIKITFNESVYAADSYGNGNYDSTCREVVESPFRYIVSPIGEPELIEVCGEYYLRNDGTRVYASEIPNGEYLIRSKKLDECSNYQREFNFTNNYIPGTDDRLRNKSGDPVTLTFSNCNCEVEQRFVITPNSELPAYSKLIELCEGESIELGGQTFSAEGDYPVRVSSGSEACDTLVTYQVRFRQRPTATKTVYQHSHAPGCTPPSSVSRSSGVVQTIPEVEQQLVVPSSGCTDTLFDTVYQNKLIHCQSETIYICNGVPTYQVDQYTTLTGFGTHTFYSVPEALWAEASEVSLRQITLVDGRSFSHGYITDQTCQGAIYQNGPFTIDLRYLGIGSSTVITDQKTITNSRGCDSVVNLTLTVLSQLDTINKEICRGETILHHGQSYTPTQDMLLEAYIGGACAQVQYTRVKVHPIATTTNTTDSIFRKNNASRSSVQYFTYYWQLPWGELRTLDEPGNYEAWHREDEATSCSYARLRLVDGGYRSRDLTILEVCDASQRIRFERDGQNLGTYSASTEDYEIIHQGDTIYLKVLINPTVCASEVVSLCPGEQYTHSDGTVYGDGDQIVMPPILTSANSHQAKIIYIDEADSCVQLCMDIEFEECEDADCYGWALDGVPIQSYNLPNLDTCIPIQDGQSLMLERIGIVETAIVCERSKMVGDCGLEINLLAEPSGTLCGDVEAITLTAFSTSELENPTWMTPSGVRSGSAIVIDRPGTYTVHAESGCLATASITIDSSSSCEQEDSCNLKSIHHTVEQISCDRQTISITPTTYGHYTGSFGDFEWQFYTPTATENYTIHGNSIKMSFTGSTESVGVRVDDGRCQHEFVLDVPPIDTRIPEVSISAVPQEAGEGDTVMLFATVTNGVALSATDFRWRRDGAPAGSGNPITVVGSGNYTVRAAFNGTLNNANADGVCYGEAAIEIEHIDDDCRLELNGILMSPARLCAGGTVSLNPIVSNPDGAVLTYEWSGYGVGPAMLEANSAGRYELIVTDDQGCRRTGSLEVLAADQISLSVSASASSVCVYDGIQPGQTDFDEPVTITAQVSGLSNGATASYRWTNSEYPDWTYSGTSFAIDSRSGDYLSGPRYGTFTVMVSDDQGCDTVSASVTVARKCSGCQNGLASVDLSSLIEACPDINTDGYLTIIRRVERISGQGYDLDASCLMDNEKFYELAADLRDIVSQSGSDDCGGSGSAVDCAAVQAILDQLSVLLDEYDLCCALGLSVGFDGGLVCHGQNDNNIFNVYIEVDLSDGFEYSYGGHIIREERERLNTALIPDTSFSYIAIEARHRGLECVHKLSHPVVVHPANGFDFAIDSFDKEITVHPQEICPGEMVEVTVNKTESHGHDLVIQWSDGGTYFNRYFTKPGIYTYSIGIDNQAGGTHCGFQGSIEIKEKENCIDCEVEILDIEFDPDECEPQYIQVKTMGEVNSLSFRNPSNLDAHSPFGRQRYATTIRVDDHTLLIGPVIARPGSVLLLEGTTAGCNSVAYIPDFDAPESYPCSEDCFSRREYLRVCEHLTFNTDQWLPNLCSNDPSIDGRALASSLANWFCNRHRYTFKGDANCSTPILLALYAYVLEDFIDAFKDLAPYSGECRPEEENELSCQEASDLYDRLLDIDSWALPDDPDEASALISGCGAQCLTSRAIIERLMGDRSFLLDSDQFRDLMLQYLTQELTLSSYYADQLATQADDDFLDLLFKSTECGAIEACPGEPNQLALVAERLRQMLDRHELDAEVFERLLSDSPYRCEDCDVFTVTLSSYWETDTLCPGGLYGNRSYLWYNVSSSRPIASYELIGGGYYSSGFNILTVDQGGTYTFKATDPTGCEAEVTIEVIEYCEEKECLFTPGNRLVASDSTICTEGQEITLFGPDAYEGRLPIIDFNYEWDHDGSTSQNVTITEPGYYGLTITTEQLCKAYLGIEIQDGRFDADVIATKDSICAEETIILSAQADSEAGELSYFWLKDGIELGTGEQLLATSSGSYSLMVSNEHCDIELSYELYDKCQGCISNIPEGDSLADLLGQLCPDLSLDRLDSMQLAIEMAKQLVMEKDTASCALADSSQLEMTLLEVVDIIESIRTPDCELPVSRSASVIQTDSCDNFSELTDSLWQALQKFDSCCRKTFEVMADKTEYCYFGDPIKLTVTPGFDMYKWDDSLGVTTVPNLEVKQAGQFTIVAIDKSLGCQKKATTPMLTVSDTVCGDIPIDVLTCAFPNTDTSVLREVLTAFNKYKEQFGFATYIQIAHFLGQVAVESNLFRNTREDCRYSEKAVKASGWGKRFCHFYEGFEDPDLCNCDSTCRISDTTLHKTGFSIDSISTYNMKSSFVKSCSLFDFRYGCNFLRNKNGAPCTGDGSKFSGSGYLQLTGRNNYEKMTEIWNCDPANTGNLKDFADSNYVETHTDIDVMMKISMYFYTDGNTLPLPCKFNINAKSTNLNELAKDFTECTIDEIGVGVNGRKPGSRKVNGVWCGDPPEGLQHRRDAVRKFKKCIESN